MWHVADQGRWPMHTIAKLLLSFSLLTTTSAVLSQPILDTKYLGEKIKEIPLIEVAPGAYLPAFIQYFQNSRTAPSCSLVGRGGRVDVIVFDEDNLGSYSNCNKIYPSEFTYVDGVLYASYKYLEEETRGHIIPGFITIRIDHDMFASCTNNGVEKALLKEKKLTPEGLAKVLRLNPCKPSSL